MAVICSVASICRLCRLLIDTARIICVHSNEGRPLASDLEGLTEADSLTFDELVETAFMLVLDQ
jgi:hypothetical protein